MNPLATDEPESGLGRPRSPMLTRRQRETVQLLAHGLSNRRIAEELGVSPGTVANYVRGVLSVLGLRSRAQVAAWAVEHGIGGKQDRLLTLLERLLAIEATDLESALTAAADVVAQALGADKTDCFLLDSPRDTLVAVGTSRTAMGRRQRAIGMDRLPLANGGRTVEVFKTNRSHATGRADLDPLELQGVVQALGVRSTLNVPLAVDGQPRGVLTVASERPNYFGERDFRFLESVAHWVGMVAHRAELVPALKAEAAASARRATAEELVTVVAHDLRNQLTPIHGRVERLQRRAGSDGAVRDERELRDLQELARGVGRLERLVADLLDVARLEHGLFALSPRPFDLAGVVREAAEALSTPDVPIRVEGPAKLVLIADADRVRQAVENLLSNAVEHASAGTAVSVDLAREQRDTQEWLAVAVANQGGSIASEALPRLFERYATGSSSRGLGLGLYLSSCIAAAHGGSLAADPSVAGGVCMRLTLPIVAR